MSRYVIYFYSRYVAQAQFLGLSRDTTLSSFHSHNSNSRQGRACECTSLTVWVDKLAHNCTETMLTKTLWVQISGASCSERSIVLGMVAFVTRTSGKTGRHTYVLLHISSIVVDDARAKAQPPIPLRHVSASIPMKTWRHRLTARLLEFLD